MRSAEVDLHPAVVGRAPPASVERLTERLRALTRGIRRIGSRGAQGEADRVRRVDSVPAFTSAEVARIAFHAAAAVLAGGAYSALVPGPTGPFFEGLLLVVTVALTLLVALATTAVQRADREFRVLQRLGDRGLALVRRLAVLGVLIGAVAVGVGLAHVGLGVDAPASLGVTAAAVVPAALSTFLLADSFRLTTRLFAPSHVVTAIVRRLPRASERSAGSDSSDVVPPRADGPTRADVLEVLEGYGQVLLMANDVKPYEVLLDGLADAERRATPSVGKDARGTEDGTAEELRERLVRMVLAGLDSPVFTRAGIRAFEHASTAAAERLLSILESVALREHVDGTVIREILQRGTEVTTRAGSEAVRGFWAGALPVLAGPAAEFPWDDRHLDHLVVSVFDGHLPPSDLGLIVKEVLRGWEDPTEGQHQRLVQVARGLREVAERPARLLPPGADAEVLTAKKGVLSSAGARLAPRALRLAVLSTPPDEIVDTVLDSGGLDRLVDTLITEWSNLRGELEKELRRLDVDRRLAFATVIVATAARKRAPWDGAELLRRNLDGIEVPRAARHLERTLTRFSDARGAPAALSRLLARTEAMGVVEATHVLIANRRRSVRPGREHFAYLTGGTLPLPEAGADVRRGILVRAAQSVRDRRRDASEAPSSMRAGAGGDTIVDTIRLLAAREDPDSEEMRMVAGFLEEAVPSTDGRM